MKQVINFGTKSPMHCKLWVKVNSLSGFVQPDWVDNIPMARLCFAEVSCRVIVPASSVFLLSPSSIFILLNSLRVFSLIYSSQPFPPPLSVSSPAPAEIKDSQQQKKFGTTLSRFSRPLVADAIAFIPYLSCICRLALLSGGTSCLSLAFPPVPPPRKPPRASNLNDQNHKRRPNWAH